MITLNMTPQETLKELSRDRYELMQLNGSYLAHGYCKGARKATTFPVSYSHKERTSTGNNYIVTNTFENKLQAYKNSPAFGTYAIIETDKGKVAVYCSWGRSADGGWCACYCMPHLFSRYRERMGFEDNGEALIRRFFKRNKEFIFKSDYRRKSMDDETNLMYLCFDGAIFGRVHPQDKNSVVFLTFIANDTMQEGYKSKFNRSYNEDCSEISKTFKLLFGDALPAPMFNIRK